MEGLTETMEGLTDELTSLVSALSMALQGSSAVALLPSAEPEFQRDFAVSFCFALALFAVNWGVRLLMLQPCLRRSTLMKEGRIQKCSQSAMEVLFYSTFSVVGLSVVPSFDWVWPSTRWWAGSITGSLLRMRRDLRCYYLLYASRYAQMAVSVLLEHKRSDFGKMILHHVATLVLVIISYAFGWGRVGSIIMMIMDLADPPLQLAKVFKYIADCHEGRGLCRMLSNVCFQLFAVVFFVTRILMFGYVLWSIVFEMLIPASEEARNKWGYKVKVSGYAAVMLCFLIASLNLFWFMLILNVIIKVIYGQDADDERSDDENDDGKKKR